MARSTTQTQQESTTTTSQQSSTTGREQSSTWGSQQSSTTGSQQSSQQSQSTERTQSGQSTQSSQQSQSTTSSILNEALRDVILSGLRGTMTDEEISAYAENLLRPTLNAGLEASQQQYEASRLGYEQEIENLAAQLTQAIAKQQESYRQSDAGLETSALARGMGRSSYLLDAKTQLSRALSETIRSLTDESARQSGQIQQKITLAGQQNAQTQGRLNTDYARELAAKVQALKDAQRQEYNQNYMTATSAAMGTTTQGTSSGTSTTQGQSLTTGTSQSQTTGTSQSQTAGTSQSQTMGTSQSQTTGTSTSHTSGSSTSSTVSSGGGSGSSKSTTGNTYTVDEYVSGTAKRDKNLTIN